MSELNLELAQTKTVNERTTQRVDQTEAVAPSEWSERAKSWRTAAIAALIGAAGFEYEGDTRAAVICLGISGIIGARALILGTVAGSVPYEAEAAARPIIPAQRTASE